MFEMGSAAWIIVARSVVVFVAVFLGLRVAGKRELGQMTVFDLAVILLISNAVQNAMVGPDLSVQGGITAAATLLVLDRAVARLRLHGGVWGRLIEGTPPSSWRTASSSNPISARRGSSATSSKW